MESPKSKIHCKFCGENLIVADNESLLCLNIKCPARRENYERKRTFSDFCRNTRATIKLFTQTDKQCDDKLLALIREYRHEILDAMLEKEREERENIDAYKQAEAEEARRFTEL